MKKHPQGIPLIMKSIDGGDVVLDLQIQYRLNPDFAVQVIQEYRRWVISL